jgi:type I restriction enzyme, S subunit
MDLENDELPEGWTVSTVGELGQVQLGKMLDRAKNQGSPVSYLRNINVRWFDFALEDLKSVRVSDEELARFSVEDGDLFICEGGEPGRCAVWRNGSNTMVYQKALHRFRTKGAILPVLLMYRLRQEAEIGRLHEWFSGSTIKHLTRENFVKFEVPVPPLAEQKRIADKLEAVLGRVDACRARLDRVPGLLKRFRQSVLAAATSGKLTEEWRMTNGVSEEWKDVRLGQIADVHGGITKDSKKQLISDEEIPYLRVANVQRGYLDLTEIKTIRIPAAKAESLLLRPGDVLFNEGGDIDKLGRGWVWEGQIPRCSYQNHVFRARLSSRGDQPKYISWWGNFRGLEYFLRSGKQTTNLASINKSMLCDLPISLPSPAEQQEIVRRVEDLFAFADRIEARLATARKTVERLTPATLAKAFRGELVPQDPNDEPASALLERLLAQSAPAAAKPKRARRAAQA